MTARARVVPAAEIAPVLNEMHDRLAATAMDGPHRVQVHEYLDIDPDIANRDYPPMPWARRADTCDPADYAASGAAGYVEEPGWDPAPTRQVQDDVALLLGLPDCDPQPVERPVQDVPTGGLL